MKKKSARRKINIQALVDGGPQHGDRILFTREQAPGAIPNGTAVVKCNTEPRDGHQDGDPAHILGSLLVRDEIWYFVEWLDRPSAPVLTMGSKIRRME